MKKRIAIIVVTVIFVIAILSSLISFAMNSSEEIKLEDKVSEEIDYLNRYFVSILAKFNGLTIENDVIENHSENTTTKNTNNTTSKKNQNEQSESNENQNSAQQNNQVDSGSDINQNSILSKNGKYNTEWESIQLEVEELYQIWNTITLDLHALNIDGNAILSFSDSMNKLTQNVKKKDKTTSMQEISNLYKLLLEYKQSYKPNDKNTNMFEIETNIINAYVQVNDNKWDKAQEALTNAEEKLATILNTVSEPYQNQTVINQTYILLNELRRAANIQDQDIFYIQFQNIMKKMIVLV